MDFMLGLVLSLTDNATAGINNAVNSLQNLTQTAEGASQSLNQMASLSALSVVSDKLGSSFMQAGRSIISTLSGVISSINTTGMSLMMAENQLDALYKESGKTGKEVISQIQKYAKESMFDFENLIPAVTSLKSVGIEAFDAITSSTGNAKYSLLDYASALASFAPQMKNAYGTGVNAAIGAMREYIAEGNAMSLKRGAGLDITGILGEDKGATIEERTRQVADLVEKLGMLGMVDAMKESPMTKLSNMGDVLFQLKGMISDSEIGGLSTSINSIIDIFYNFVDSIGDARLETIAKNIGSALTSIIKPVEWLSKRLVSLAEGIVSLVENNPALVKMATIGIALVGVLLVIAGIALKVTSALSGLSLMILATGTSFKSIGGLMKTGVLKMLGVLLPFIATIGLMSIAWKNDLAGIRTNVTYFVNNLSNSFKTAKQAVNGSVSDLTSKLAELRSKGDFFSNLTIGMMKVMMIGKALSDAWGDFTLSEENYLKAKELGVLPLIEAILDLKYRFGLFKEGFIAGWNEVSNAVSNFVRGLVSSLDGTVFDSMIEGVTNLLEALSNNDPEAWKEFGRVMGDLSAKILIAYSAFKLFKGVSGILSPIISVFKSLFSNISFTGLIQSISGVFDNIITYAYVWGDDLIKFIVTIPQKMGGYLTSGLQKIFGSSISGLLPNLRIIFAGLADSMPSFIQPLIAKIGSVLSGVVGFLSSHLIAIIAVVLSGIIAYAVTHWEEFKEKILSVWTTIKESATEIWESIKGGIARIWENLKSAVTPVVDAFNKFKDKLVELGRELGNNEKVQALIGILSAIGETIVNIVVPAIQGLFNIFTKVFTSIWNVVVTVFNSIVNVISSVLSNVMNIIGGVLDIIVGLFTGNFDRVLQGVGTVFTSIVNVISTLLQSAWNIIMSILSGIANFFSSILTTIVNVVSGAFQGIVSIVGSLLDAVFSKVSSVWDSIKTKVDTVVGNLSSSVQTKWNTIKTTITSAIEGARDKVKSAIEKIKSFFNFTWKLPSLKLPHITITGGFSIAPPSVPKFSIDWYEKGGVFDSPSVIGVGENGREAVMPLEKNIGWINELAGMLTTSMQTLIPTNSNQYNTTNQGGSHSYLTNNNTNNQTHYGDTDNSVVFNQGAIQVNIQKATEEEAIKLAKKVMLYIKRQKELDKIYKYA